jgi:predicted nucleic acid-binding protein
MVVLDTCVVSALMQRQPEALLNLREHRASEVVICTPVAAEIRYGLARLAAGSRRLRLLTAEYERLREAVSWADWSEPAAAEYGRVKAGLEQDGQRLDDMDLAIASVALANRARLATYNVRHFSRVGGLPLLDWSLSSEM